MGTMCDNFIIYEDNQNEFKMWQGLVGAHYTPYVDSIGNLSWTNNGGLPNPPTVNIAGKGLNIVGIVDEDTDLPETASNFDTYLVGTEDPYSAYIYDNGTWYNLGIIGQGEKGDPGEGVPTGGTTGQVLAKASGADYDTEWKTPDPGVDPATSAPLMDGTAAVGTSTKYAREDHVHPVDTSRASASDVSSLTAEVGTFVHPNLLDNWYFVGGGSQQGGGQFPINQRGQTVYTGNGNYSIDRWYLFDGNVTATVQSNGLKIVKSSGSWYTITQKLENPTQYIGKKLTVSCLYEGTSTSNVSIRLCYHSSSGIIARGEGKSGGLISATGTVPDGITALWVSFYSTVNTTTDIVVKAIKLEIGDTQTLAHQENGVWVLNEIPNYEEELIRCKTSTADSTDTYANQKIAYTNDMVAIRSKQVTIPADSDHVAITPTTVSGYTFFCWLAPASSGWIGSVYVEDPSLSSTNVWALNVASSARNVNLAMVYIKN